MLKLLKVRLSQGKQYVPNVRDVLLKGFRGLPKISNAPCETDCTACKDECPTDAILLDPLRIDLGRCVFCDDCTRVCPAGKITFTTEFKMASHSRERLTISDANAGALIVETSQKIKNIFGRSLKLRSVSAGGCNACELEINALSNVNFDIGRFGIEFVASPTHTDGLILSGPITKNMKEALDLAYEGVPDPKFVIAVGACAISGGLFEMSTAVDRAFLGKFAPSLYLPGCPPHPLTIVNGILDLLGK